MRVGLVLSIVVLIFCLGCSHRTGGKQYPAEFGSSSTVAVSQPDFKPRRDELLNWFSEVIWVGESVLDQEKLRALKQFVKQELEQQLKAKGYRVSEVDKNTLYTQAHYQIVAMIVQGEISDKPEVASLVKLYPGLSEQSRTAKKGTLIFAIVPTGTKKAAWRGAIQVFTAKPGELPIEVRRARLSAAVANLIRSVPKPI